MSHPKIVLIITPKINSIVIPTKTISTSDKNTSHIKNNTISLYIKPSNTIHNIQSSNTEQHIKSCNTISLYIKPTKDIELIVNRNIKPIKKHYCYLLQSLSRPRKTYIGYTINPKRRLRQHNGEITGGAKKTSYARPWRMICFICGFPTHRSALQFEYANHHPRVKQWGVNGRIKTLAELLYYGNWTKTSPDINTIFLELTWLVDGYSLPYRRWNCVELSAL